QTSNTSNSGGGATAVDPKNPNNIYHVHIQGDQNANALIRRSTDGGQTWATVLTTLATTATLTLDNINPSRLLEGSGNGAFVTTGNGSLWESVNQGTTWTRIFTGTSPFGLSAIAVAAYQG